MTRSEPTTIITPDSTTLYECGDSFVTAQEYADYTADEDEALG